MANAALITGANGFVGRVLSAYLRSKKWQVREAVMPGQPEGPNCFACDITDASQVHKLVSRADGLTHLFHLAAVTFVPTSSSNPGTTMRVNVEGTINLMEAMRATHPKARFMFVGSAAVYGSPRNLPVLETHRFDPREPYAISKAAADEYCAYAGRAHKLDVVRMRPFNHSGAGQSDQFVLSNFARQVARIERGELPPVLRTGNLSAARDFLHVNDVVRAYELAAIHANSGEAYNVCSGVGHPIQHALDTLLSMARVPISHESDPARMRAVDVSEISGSHQKLKQHTQWEPRIPFEQILEDLLAYWREHQ